MSLLKVVSLLLLCLALPCAVTADGMMFMDAEAVKAAKEQMEHMLINEPEQKAVIFFDKGEEQLIISPSYDGAPEKFAWVVPVPSKPKVEIADMAIFYELMDITTPIIASASPRKTEEPQVKVLERKTVGNYDVSILSSTDGSALMDWLTSNGYHVPEKALEPIRDYVRRRWTFVASKVIDTEPGTVEGLKNGTLAPLKLTFRTSRPVYPLKLSSANPKPFDLQVYIIVPVKLGKFRYIKSDRTPIGAYQPYSSYYGPSTDLTHLPQAYIDEYEREDYPFISKLSPYSMQIFEGASTLGTFRITPEECKCDLYWSIMTYVTYQEEPPQMSLSAILNLMFAPFCWDYQEFDFTYLGVGMPKEIVIPWRFSPRYY